MAATIFSGDKIKALLPALGLGNAATIRSGTTNPQVTPTAGNRGDVYISTGASATIYQKITTDGTDTNWALIPSSIAGLAASSVVVTDTLGNIKTNGGITYNSATSTLTVTNFINSGLTANTVPYANGSKQLTSSSVTPTELGYLSGVTSSIQTQLNGKQSTLTIGTLSTSTTGISLIGGTNAVIGTGTTINISNSSASTNGLLTQTDWTTFNNKANSSLNNLTTTSINQDLIPNGNFTRKLGSATAVWMAYIGQTFDTSNNPTASLTSRELYDSVGSIAVDWGNRTLKTVSNTIVLDWSGPNVSLNSHSLTNVVDPVGAQDAATKAYVDAGLAALNPTMSVRAATTSASNTSSYTYLNGIAGIGATFTGPINTPLVVDGVTFNAIGQRLLVKDDTQSPSGAFNGIYYVTQLSGIATPVILTRALDFNQPSTINNSGLIPVINGTVNALSSWDEIATITTIGTDALVFSEFTANPSLYLLKSNNLNDVANSTTAFNNIVNTNSVTNVKLAQMPANTIKGNNTGSTANATDLTILQVQTLLNVAVRSSGDLNEGSFNIANNQSSLADVTGLAFSNASVRAAQVFYSVYINATSSLYESGELLLVQKGSSWTVSRTFQGDNSLLTFDVTNAGQVQYTSANYSGFTAGTIKFRAITTST